MPKESEFYKKALGDHAGHQGIFNTKTHQKSPDEMIVLYLKIIGKTHHGTSTELIEPLFLSAVCFSFPIAANIIELNGSEWRIYRTVSGEDVTIVSILATLVILTISSLHGQSTLV